jgi:hypothetical protein
MGSTDVDVIHREIGEIRERIVLSDLHDLL